jgi:murein DD-endopeptidase MepM/ murein hydrolase activator NlpD
VRLLKPWPDPYTVNPNGKYGNRRHPITGRTKKHRGLDVAYSGLIYAPADGEVVHKGAALNKRTGGGYTLIVKHAKDLYTVYYHLREPSKLAVGARVRLGDVLAHTGTTGASTGVHLHWETRSSRRFGSDFDPATVTDMSRSAANGGTPSTGATPKPESATPKLVEDGILGRNTWGAVQRMLQAEGHYKGRINGVPGNTTIKALQQWLNEVA